MENETQKQGLLHPFQSPDPGITYIYVPSWNTLTYLLEIADGSMHPVLPQGAYGYAHILADPSQMVIGEAYLIVSDGGWSFKVFEGEVNGQITLRSADPAFNPVEPIALTEVKAVFDVERMIVYVDENTAYVRDDEVD